MRCEIRKRSMNMQFDRKQLHFALYQFIANRNWGFFEIFKYFANICVVLGNCVKQKLVTLLEPT